jgi:hypothetical protein
VLTRDQAVGSSEAPHRDEARRIAVNIALPELLAEQ